MKILIKNNTYKKLRIRMKARLVSEDVLDEKYIQISELLRNFKIEDLEELEIEIEEVGSQ